MNTKWKKRFLKHNYHPEIVDCLYEASGYIGLYSKQDNAHKISATHHYNGSGDKAFGGARWWPVAAMEISFQQGEEAKRDAFIKKLQQWLDNNLP